jgi:glycosyltransferase involved in cell wall biosynthesis
LAYKLAVVVPTLNRPSYLRALLENLSTCEGISRTLVIVVDSSDEKFETVKTYPFALDYRLTSDRSAARQRNLGMEILHKEYNFKGEFLAFLDDDVRVPSDYFSRAGYYFLENNQIVGISGVTQLENRPERFRIFRKLFGFVSTPGSISKGGINNPISNRSLLQIVESKWLIGCAIWNYGFIKDARFEADFNGSSIYEDVIFSYQAGRKGKLFVIPTLQIEHLLAKDGRQSRYSQNLQWVLHRYRLFEKFPDDFHLRHFWIANLGKFFFEALYGIMKLQFSSLKGAMGVAIGSLQVFNR